MSKYFKWAEVRERDDLNSAEAFEGTTRWGNHDIYPVPLKERNYGILGFYSYFACGAISVYGFTAASAFVSAGLGTWDTVGAICLGSCIAAFNGYLGSRIGIDTSLGFTIMTRATFGLRGAIIPILNATVASVIFVGLPSTSPMFPLLTTGKRIGWNQRILWRPGSFHHTLCCHTSIQRFGQYTA